MNIEHLAAIMNMKGFAKKIYGEVKKFEESLDENFFVVAKINGEKIFLEEIIALEDKFIIFIGKDFENNSVKIFSNHYNLNFVLSSKKISEENSVQKRKPIGFLTE